MSNMIPDEAFADLINRNQEPIVQKEKNKRELREGLT